MEISKLKIFGVPKNNKLEREFVNYLKANSLIIKKAHDRKTKQEVKCILENGCYTEIVTSKEKITSELNLLISMLGLIDYQIEVSLKGNEYEKVEKLKNKRKEISDKIYLIIPFHDNRKKALKNAISTIPSSKLFCYFDAEAIHSDDNIDFHSIFDEAYRVGYSIRDNADFDNVVKSFDKIIKRVDDRIILGQRQALAAKVKRLDRIAK